MIDALRALVISDTPFGASTGRDLPREGFFRRVGSEAPEPRPLEPLVDLNPLAGGAGPPSR